MQNNDYLEDQLIELFRNLFKSKSKAIKSVNSLFTVPVKLEPIITTHASNTNSKTKIMESNQLGKSITKASWIVSVAIIVCMVIYVSNNRIRYTPMGSSFYIDQQSGYVHAMDGTVLNKPK